MSWVIVDRNTGLKSGVFSGNSSGYSEISTAKAAITRAVNNGRIETDCYNIVSLAEYHANMPMVTRYNLMTGKPFQIRADQVGGPCDPATERYWSM